MKKRIRILQILCEPISNGGQESFIMNMYRNIDRDKIQFDFFTPYYCDNEKLKTEIKEMGGNVYALNGDFDGKERKKYLRKNVKKFLETNKYDFVHIHSGSIYSLITVAKIAKKNATKNVIVHSHCGGFDNLKYRIIKFVSKPYMLKYPDKYYACSKLAAEWKYPKKVIKNNEYIVLKNAIDTSKIYFSEEIRQEYRKNMNLENNFVVGHIGRFAIQKNHDFLIDVFYQILKKKSNAELLLIGVGELQNEIIEKVKMLGIENNVHFLGIRNDINGLLNAMDIFLLPSFFEGLPVVGVEAQATGLPVYASDRITKELPINELSHYYSLESSAKEWSDNIIEDIENFRRENTTKKIIQEGYDVKEAAKLMENYYISMNK